MGTWADGLLPIMAEVYDLAARRNVEVVALPTESACRLISHLEPDDVNAVLRVTCQGLGVTGDVLRSGSERRMQGTRSRSGLRSLSPPCGEAYTAATTVDLWSLHQQR